MPKLRAVLCELETCRKPFTAKRSDARYCSPSCRRTASRNRAGAPPEPGGEVSALPAEAKRPVDDANPTTSPPATPCPTCAGSGVAPDPMPDPQLVQQVSASLAEVGKLDTWEGVMAVAAARKISANATTAAHTGSLMKELKATMAELTRTATPAADARRPGVAVRGRWRHRVEDVA